MDSRNQSADPFYPWKMYPLQKTKCQASDSANGTSPEKSHDSFQTSFFVLGHGSFCVCEAWKRHGETLVSCLFTCINTHVVNLELVQSMGTDDFIMCLGRFINRRGVVSEMRCDRGLNNRGSNFVGAKES